MKAVRRSRTSLFNGVLRNFLFKEIFKGCCLLFSYQGPLPFFPSDSFDSISKRILHVKNFFLLFRFPFSGSAQIYYHFPIPFVNYFLQVFQLFPRVNLPVLYLVFCSDTTHNPLLRTQKLLELSSSFRMISNGERGI